MIVTDIKNEIISRIKEHEVCFESGGAPLLKISTCYPGLWMEHIYDSIIYAQIDESKLYLAENAINTFIDLQTEDGQIPYVIRSEEGTGIIAGYSQIQECVSFGSLAYAVYEKNGDRVFLKKAYDAICKWVSWLKNNRMTLGTGLVEMFFGYDTGHDNSARVLDLAVPGNYRVDGKAVNAKVLPPDDNISPVIALDMNCNYYGNLKALERMAKALGIPHKVFSDEAKQVKEKIFEICFDKDDFFFYDVDRNGNKRKILSSQIFHLFIEGVLDKELDSAIIEELSKRYIFNDKHFFTPYPFPAVSVSDRTWKKHTPSNCWGYYTQSLIVLRCTLWMDRYGYSEQFDEICKRFLKAWTDCFDTVKLGQELDPITGEPSECSEWYSSCMLMYLYCASRINQ